MYNICTTIEQSKKLIELEIDRTTADMYYSFDYNIEEYDEDAQIIPKSELDQHFSLFPKDIPCWSLAALLNVLPRINIEKETWSDDTYDYRIIAYIDDGYIGDWFNNPIDACYDMIIKLHEDKLL